MAGYQILPVIGNGSRNFILFGNLQNGRKYEILISQGFYTGVLVIIVFFSKSFYLHYHSFFYIITHFLHVVTCFYIITHFFTFCTLYAREFTFSLIFFHLAQCYTREKLCLVLYLIYIYIAFSSSNTNANILLDNSSY